LIVELPVDYIVPAKGKIDFIWFAADMKLTNDERQEADGLAGQAQRDFPILSISAGGRSDREDQSDPARLGEVLRDWPRQPMFLLYPKLGGDEDSASSGSGVPASRLRLEAVEQGMAVR